eukprot:COSAG01_NODE_62643_length_283_cov_1.402174_1_plen_62_part_10
MKVNGHSEETQGRRSGYRTSCAKEGRESRTSFMNYSREHRVENTLAWHDIRKGPKVGCSHRY